MVSKAFRNVEKVKNPNDGVLQVLYTSSTATSTPTTAYATVAGSAITFTPKVTGSAVLYTFEAQCSGLDAHGIIHYWLQTSEDNVTWTNRVRRSLSANSSPWQQGFSMSYQLTGNVAGDARYFRVQVRNYGTANRAMHGICTYWDGSGTDQAGQTTAYCMEYVNQTVVT